MFVEVQDETGKAIVGFTAEDADEINGNYIRKVATWNGSSDVSSLAGKPVRLRFVMRGTKLYAFQFKLSHFAFDGNRHSAVDVGARLLEMSKK